MIKEHALNTRWWGDAVGVVTNPDFFTLAPAGRSELLKPYAWVELSLGLSDSLQHARAIFETGFAQVDTQVTFRISIRRVPDSESLAALQTQFADESSFSMDGKMVADFRSERFLQIPGATQELVNQRYALWSSDLINASPDYCVQVLYDGRVQGWFLSRPDEGVNLSLAMLSSEATVSGMYVYRKALRAYAERGHALGWASFSVSNTPVHNIYSNLGARFVSPKGNWLWIASD
jgi:hypothetical protein